MSAVSSKEILAGKNLVDRLFSAGYDIGLAAWFPDKTSSSFIFLFNLIAGDDREENFRNEIDQIIQSDIQLKEIFSNRSVKIIDRNDQISRDFRLAVITSVVNQGIQIKNSTFGETFMDGVVLYVSK